jgi:hypothetical protein
VLEFHHPAMTLLQAHARCVTSLGACLCTCEPMVSDLVWGWKCARSAAMLFAAGATNPPQGCCAIGCCVTFALEMDRTLLIDKFSYLGSEEKGDRYESANTCGRNEISRDAGRASLYRSI